MNARELLVAAAEMKGPHDDQPPVNQDALEVYFASVRQAYESAKINHRARGELLPGLTEDGFHFQVGLIEVHSVIHGSRYLLRNEDDTHVDEMDLFMWNKRFDVSAGRLRQPEDRSLTDYHLTTARLSQVTGYILQQVKSEKFMAVEKLSVLGLPQ